MREFHSLKGSARSLQLAQLATSAHRIESLLLAARESGELGPDERQSVQKSLSSVKEGIRNIRTTIDRFMAFRVEVDITPRRELEASIASFTDMVGQLGRDLGKEVTFEPSIAVAELPFLRELKNPIIHLLRNAMDHGIEEVYQRTASGKPAAGKVRLEIFQEGSEIHVAVRDDGKGIDFERIREKAMEKGLLPKGSTASPADLVPILFNPGFSSKDVVSEISGRGVGLDAVQDAVKQLGGKISVATTLGAGTRFLLAIPLKRAADARSTR